VTLDELEALVLALQSRVGAFESAAQQLAEGVDQNRREVNAAIAVAQALSDRLQAQTTKVEVVDQRLRDEADAMRVRQLGRGDRHT
jgi:hypothetical protein